MIVSGIAAWACIQKPKPEGKYQGKKIPAVYTIDVFLDKDKAKELKKKGYNIKTAKQDVPGLEKSKGKPFLQVKKKAFYDDGNPVAKPRCVDSAKQEFTGLIGNGSKVNVSYNEYEWESFGSKGTAAQLRGVQVVELVAFKGDEVDEFEEVDGFTSTIEDTNEAKEQDAEQDDDVEPWEE